MGLCGEHGAQHLPDWQGRNGQDYLSEDSGRTIAQTAYRGGTNRCGGHQRRRRDHPLVLPAALLALRAWRKDGEQV